ncbi:hypothetical protein PY092_02870 [Muricauda sp. 334s03]|uniref:Uncharacterized protein n=1 Tax=Flagellimonas yonaguniensis TaxID=3031325 RepID=A0ABT5XV65_9FLAO|nr:hypothetical protein [[Muricauda] yonaguniensis]MDF0715080.1 hypothetical protein [[Muricauda] yonaguniensis]
MKNLFFFLVVAILPLAVVAQNITPDVVRTVDVNLQVQKNRGEVYDTYVGVDGSPYMNDDFMPAMLYPDEKLYLARYNAKDDEIEVQLAEDKILVLDNSRRDYKMVFRDSDLTYTTLYNQGEKMSGFYVEVVTTDRISVYKKQTKRFVEGREAVDNFSKNKDAYFTEASETFYIQMKEDGPIQEMPTKRKKFSKLFDSKEDEIDDYIKDNDIDLEEESGIKKVVGFIITSK